MASGTKSSDNMWVPPNARAAPINAYREHVNKKYHERLSDTQELVDWSVREGSRFWVDLYKYLGLQPQLPGNMEQSYDSSLPMSSVPPFFEGHLMNYAENTLFSNPDDDAIALIGLREGQDLERNEEERVSWRQLRERVRVVASALKRYGIKDGDRVAALVGNSIWAVVLFLACASRGVIFSSINPDLGTEGCVSRLRQITPHLLFADGDTTYKGKQTSIVKKVDSILARLDEKPKVFLIPISARLTDYDSVDRFLDYASSNDKLEFKRVPFSYPLVIVYSSGTTGAPKCIVHQHGLVLNLKKISTLHSSLGPGDVVLQYTTTTWVMFIIMCGHLSCGCQVVCYDGSPMFPDIRHMLRILEKFKVNYFGTSPRYLLELQISGVKPAHEFDIAPLRMVNTTGAPLSLEQYRYFYSAFPFHAHLNNTAGGTDIATTLLGCDPAGPLVFGEMTTCALGMDVDVLDAETGESVKDSGQAGELVVRSPFPSMPPFFWADPTGETYKSAYFHRFPDDVWAQSDWVSFNPRTKGWEMHGRSDGVLNPSGIRFGSGEIYALVESPEFNGEIDACLCVGRRRSGDTDEDVFLFLKMLPGKTLTPELEKRVRECIARGLSRRHVPKFMVEVADVPVTINGKKVEIAVKRLISGEQVKISSTVANPEVLKGYSKYKDLESQPRKSKL